MRTLAGLGLVLIVLLPVSASAETLLQQALKELNTQAVPAPQTRMKNSGMWVGGLVLSGAGGYMLGYGLAMERGAYCTTIGRSVLCEEEGENKNLLIGAGAALTAAGIWMAYVGGQRVAVSPSIGGVRVRVNLK